MTADDWFPAARELVPDTPSLVISPARVAANVARIGDGSARAGKRLRPHTKTHKMLEIARMQLQAGAAGLQVAKLGEGEVMLQSGARDLLVAYPVVGHPKLRRLAALAKRAAVTVSLDSLEVARGISEVLRAEDTGADVTVLIEVDTGMHRVGVPPAEAGELAAAVRKLPMLRVGGVTTHEGHIGRQAASDGERADLVAAAVRDMTEAAERVDQTGVRDPLVSMGSTSTWRFLCDHPAVTEVRPGLYVFFDMNSVRARAARMQDVAAVVAATVVSRSPGRGEFVLDAGSKSLSSESSITAGTTTYGYLPEWDAHVVRVSEEHAIAAATGGRLPAIGDRVVVVPNHVCPVVNLTSTATAIDPAETVGTWQVAARGLVR
jgi:D-serine deaminase-like pyridoxal phosphate-dependent protein